MSLRVVVLSMVTLIINFGCMAELDNSPPYRFSGPHSQNGDEVDDQDAPPLQTSGVVINLTGDSDYLYLKGTPDDAEYSNQYPNPAAVDKMEVVVHGTGIIEGRCLVQGRTVACFETPFQSRVEDLSDGTTQVVVWDMFGEIVAEFNGIKEKWQPRPDENGDIPSDMPSDLGGSSPDEPATRATGDSAPETPGYAQTNWYGSEEEDNLPASGDRCAPGVLYQRMCDTVNRALARDKVPYEMPCEVLKNSTSPSPLSVLPQPGQQLRGDLLTVAMRWCAAYVEAAYLPLAVNCPTETTRLVNMGMATRQELVNEGVCLHSPLVLDLDGDGVNLTSLEDGVSFDLFGEGRPVHCAWITTGDALLVLDRNGNGTIDDGNELFGNMINGVAYDDGFAALGALDDNKDGLIDPRDTVYSDLRLWTDNDHNGVSSGTELTSLEAEGIETLDLFPLMLPRLLSFDDHGNSIPLVSEFVKKDDSRGELVDAFFRFRPIP